MEIKQILKTVAKTSFIVSSRVIGLTLLGILLNWCFLGFWVLPKFIFSPVLFQQYGIVALLLFAVFGIAFPIWYFNIARKFAFKKAVAAVFVDHSSELFAYFTDKLLEKQSVGTALQFSNAAIRKLNNIPRPLRAIFGFLVEQIPFGESFMQIIENTEITNIDSNVVGNQLSGKLRIHLSDSVLQPSLKPVFYTLAANGGAVALSIWLLGQI